MSDYAYGWMAHTDLCSTGADCNPGAFCDGELCKGPNNVTENPAYAGVVTWATQENPEGSPETASIDLASNPEGASFEGWLQIVGASAVGADTVSLDPVFHNSRSVIAPTQRWLYWGFGTPAQFTFNTPVGAPSDEQCGRMAFNDFHTEPLGFAGSYPTCTYSIPSTAPYYSNGLTFPEECDENPMTPEEEAAEFMFFDLGGCVEPYTPLCTPSTCAAQGIACGYASDGCGNLLTCDTCPDGGICGGGGAGQCGAASGCTPSTCGEQDVQCGETGDGCGNVIPCGDCPTGEVCGLGGFGQCGALP